MTNGSFRGEYPWKLAFNDYSNLDLQLLFVASIILCSASDTSRLNSEYKLCAPLQKLRR